MNLDKKWFSMDLAPKDGTSIQAVIPGHGADNIIFWLDGLYDDDGNELVFEYINGKKVKE